MPREEVASRDRPDHRGASQPVGKLLEIEEAATIKAFADPTGFIQVSLNREF